MGCVTYYIVNSNAPSYLLELFNHPAPTLRPSRLPVARVFAILSFRTSAYQNSFAIAAFYFWHSPIFCRLCPQYRSSKESVVRVPVCP